MHTSILLCAYAGYMCAGQFNFNNRILTLHAFDMHTADLFVQRAITLALFAMKNVIISIRHPNCFVLLSSKLQGLPK